MGGEEVVLVLGSGAKHYDFKKYAPNVTVLNLEATTFPDGEVFIKLPQGLLDAPLSEKIYFIQSFTPQTLHNNIWETVLFLDTANRHGINNVSVILPYLPYMRQDKIFNRGEPLSLRTFLKVIEPYISELITIHPHPDALEGYIDKPVRVISPKVFIEKVLKSLKKAHPNSEVVLVSPDVGQYKVLSKISEELGLPDPIVIFKKRKDAYTVEQVLLGDLNLNDKVCLIVDDITSTGSTLVGAANLLSKHKPAEVYAYVTHGFVGEKTVEKIKGSPIRRLFVSNSLGLGESSFLSSGLVFLDIEEFVSSSL